MGTASMLCSGELTRPVSAAVVQGQAKPLMRPAQVCAEIHGESGLEFLDGSSMRASSHHPAQSAGHAHIGGSLDDADEVEEACSCIACLLFCMPKTFPMC